MKTLSTRASKIEALLLMRARNKSRPPINMQPWERKVFFLFTNLIIKLHLHRSQEEREGGQPKKRPVSLTIELSSLLLFPVLDIIESLTEQEKKHIDSIRVNGLFQEVISKAEFPDSDKACLLEELEQSKDTDTPGGSNFTQRGGGGQDTQACALRSPLTW